MNDTLARVPPHRLAGWARLVLLLLVLCAAWALLYGWSVRAEAQDAPQVLTLAEMAPGLPGSPAEWRAVTLPDTWARHGLGRFGPARYRARLVLEAAPAEVWALRIDRLSTRADVRVNGALVHGMLTAGPKALRRPVPALIALPPTLLHAGENLLEIDVDHGARGGLSPLLLGPMEQLEGAFEHEVHLALSAVDDALALWQQGGAVILGDLALNLDTFHRQRDLVVDGDVQLGQPGIGGRQFGLRAGDRRLALLEDRDLDAGFQAADAHLAAFSLAFHAELDRAQPAPVACQV